MTPEQVLFYSVNAFGTADAIAFDERSKLLRIHDLKTGVTPASMAQLHVYAALFCLEYDKPPFEIKYDLRIYQNDEIAGFPSSARRCSASFSECSSPCSAIRPR